MDQELATFVGLLNKNRAARPVPDELAHLPNWAQHALTRIPETVAPRRSASFNGAAPEPKLKSDVAIALPAPMVRATAAPPVARDTLAAIIRELETPIEPPAASARQKPPAPIPVAPISADPAPAEAPRLESQLPAPASEKVEPAPAAVEKIDAAPTFAAVSESWVTAVADSGDVPAAVPPVLDKTDRAPATPSEAETKPAATPAGGRALAYVAAGTAVIAAVALVAGGYWYANQAGVSLQRDSMTLARASVSLARNVMTMIPPLPSALKMIAKAGIPIVYDKSPTDGAASGRTAIAVVALATAKTAALVNPSADTVAAARPAAKPAPAEKVAAKIADAAPPEVKPAVVTPMPMPVTEAKSPTQDASFQQVAMLTGPIPTAAPPTAKRMQSSGDEPTWRRNAVAAPPYSGQPQIAIVIDDLGIDSNRTQRAIALNGAVTLSFLAYASNLPEQTEAARKAGHELIVHVPMEPIVGLKLVSAGTHGANLAHDELLRRLRWDLSRFTGYVGVNNHMGNRLASDPESTQTVVAELKARGLLFLDSQGSEGGGVIAVAERLGVPTVSRDVFLDDDVGASSIDERLAALEKVARTQGTAIAVGHPHDRTLEALHTWLVSLPSKGLQLVPLTAIVRDREQHVAGAN
ncbi:MAG TPA: divergent polysaccharide deacetylase family protein [Stellaceae bacterium]|jgi:hypothetical protein|nr:divergent polysaccharide deacetylase family protein [Stellaceae bacterium]